MARCRDVKPLLHSEPVRVNPNSGAALRRDFRLGKYVHSVRSVELKSRFPCIVIGLICIVQDRSYPAPMNFLPHFGKPAQPPVGNPAHPSLKEREKMIAKNKNKKELVKKRPSDELGHTATD